MFADIHSHIIPFVDDGPKTTKEGVGLVKHALLEGCDRIIATPHFYPAKHGLEERIEQIKTAFADFKNALAEEGVAVNLALGFEVRYFNGISRSEEVGKLCLGKSNTLLLELGNEPITERVLEDIAELQCSGFDVVLAHIERYYKVRGYKKIVKFIAGGGAKAQITASSLLLPYFFKPAMSLLKSNLVTYVAGDMHSVKERPPKMKEAFEIIADRFGKWRAEKLLRNSECLFNDVIKL